ncbi:MAG: M48 family metalloprotease [Candidatus Micrarchaeia archaeon]
MPKFNASEVLLAVSGIAFAAYLLTDHWMCIARADTLAITAGFFAASYATYRARAIFSSYRARATAIMASLMLATLPLTTWLVAMNCDMLSMKVLFGALPLAVVLSAAMFYLLGSRLFVAAIGGQALPPSHWLHALNERLSAEIGMAAPELRFINKQEPIAFSVVGEQSFIVMSVGALELLPKKKLELILLHELRHIKRKDPFVKLTAFLLAFFSPTGLLGKHALAEIAREQEKSAS